MIIVLLKICNRGVIDRYVRAYIYLYKTVLAVYFYFS